MGYFRRFLLCFLFLCLLSTAVLGADALIDPMELKVTVDQNGTAQFVTELHVTSNTNLAAFSLDLGPNVRGVHLDTYTYSTSKQADRTVLTVTSQNGLPSTMDLHLSYTVYNTATATAEGQKFEISLLGAIKNADLDNFRLELQMPGEFESVPAFLSGYYADGIDNYLKIDTTQKGQITARSTATMLAGETLQLSLELPEGYFTLENTAGRFLIWVGILMLVLALLGGFYWYRNLRYARPHPKAQSQPPAGVEPGVTAHILFGHRPSLSLMVMGWAAEGYLRIFRARDGQIILTQLIPMGSERTSYEQKIFASLFEGEPEVSCSGSIWRTAKLRGEKAAKAYWRVRLYQKHPGKPMLLRLICILLWGFASVFAADSALPSMELRLLALLGFLVFGILFGILLDYSIRHLPLAETRTPMYLLLAGLALFLAACILTGCVAVLLPVLLYTVLAELFVLCGPRRRRNGINLLSELLGWRRYLRSLTPGQARKYLKTDPQFYYRKVLYAHGLGLGNRFTRTFAGCKLEPCAFLVREGKNVPARAEKYYRFLTAVLADMEHQTADSAPRPREARDHNLRRNNNPRPKRTETYEPEY